MNNEPAPAPAPVRNEKNRCCDCDNRQDCDDYTNGRQKACTDEFVPWNKAPAPAPTGVCKQCGKPVVLGKDGCCNNGHELCADCWNKAGKNCPVCLARYQAPAPAPKDCRGCIPPSIDICIECRKNMELKQPAPKVTDSLRLKSYEEQADAWDHVFCLCKSLGMKHDTPSGLGDVESFIRSLAQRAGEERYTVEEIVAWLQYLYGATASVLPVGGAIEVIDNERDGIAAVTKRKGG